VPAGSPQRSSLDSWPTGSAKLDVRRQLAETRKAEAEAGLVEDERRQRQAKARKTELENVEIEGRIRQQPLEARKLEAETEREEATILRELSLTLALPSILALGYVLGAGNGDNSWLLPIKLISGG